MKVLVTKSFCTMAVQLVLSPAKLPSTGQQLGIEVDDALELAEQTEV
jgi:hypothetical protein